MVVHDSDEIGVIKSNLVGERTAFTIKANKHSFRILSSKMYKHKIRAVVRELACNAVDAHTEAGTTEPIQVHLPTSFEPWFAVIDKGIGMDRQTIHSLYTEYFGSTKMNSNSLIGGLGLGSKSPFAYTDAFTIKSIKDGMQSTYTAVINDATGMPDILDIDHRPTTEGNGVEVSFPVSESDFTAFREAASVVFWAFSQKPTITGAVKGYSDLVDTLDAGMKSSWSGTDWSLYQVGWNASSIFADGFVHIKMGNVVYPFDYEKYGDDPVITSTLRQGSHLLISMPIGSCDVAPSREELDYDKQTIANVCNACNRVFAEVLAVFNKDLSTKTPWEAVAFLTAMQSKMNHPVIKTLLESPAYKDFNWMSNSKLLAQFHMQFEVTQRKRVPAVRKSINSIRPAQTIVLSLPKSSLTTKSQLTTKLKTQIGSLLLSAHQANTDIINLLVLIDPTPATFDILGQPPILIEADLPVYTRPARTPRSTPVRNRKGVFDVQGVETFSTKPKVVLEWDVAGQSLKYFDEVIPKRELPEFVAHTLDPLLAITGGTVTVIRMTTKELEKNPNVVTFKDWIISVTPALTAYMDQSFVHDFRVRMNNSDLSRMLERWPELAAHPILTAIADMRKTSSHLEHTNVVHRALSFAGQDIPSPKLEAETALTKIREAAPLISLIDHYSFGTQHLADMVSYIKDRSLELDKVSLF